jgi:hypothetical protein
LRIRTRDRAPGCRRPVPVRVARSLLVSAAVRGPASASSRSARTDSSICFH